MEPSKLLSITSGPSTVRELTGQGRGAICVLGLSGDVVPVALATNFKPVNGKPPARQSFRKPIYGHWGAEDVIVRIHETSLAEIHCHGGDFAKQKIIQDLQTLGFVLVTPPSSCDIDSATVAANIALAKATTQKTAAILTWQAEGVLDRAFLDIESAIANKELKQAEKRIAQMMRWSDLGRHLTCPWEIAIAGAPNAGKSSLINRIVGYGRSIVFDQPGTTRDLVTVETAIDGWPVKLTDTAGLRESEDPIEQQGIALSEKAVAEADLLIEVVDATNPVACFPSAVNSNHLVVLNKCDLVQCAWEGAELILSAETGEGLDQLLVEVSSRLVSQMPPDRTPIPFTPNHFERLQRLSDQVNAHKLN